LLETE